MPTYEYRCESCGRFEVFQGIKEAGLTRCPTCQGAVTRVITSGAGLLFKGSGFYTTDYRTPEYQKQQKEEQGKKDGTTDAKPQSTGTEQPKSGESTSSSSSQPSSTGSTSSSSSSEGGTGNKPST